jgi:hypothetical protein
LLHWSFCHVTLYGLYAEDIIKQRNNWSSWEIKDCYNFLYFSLP